MRTARPVARPLVGAILGKAAMTTGRRQRATSAAVIGAALVLTVATAAPASATTSPFAGQARSAGLSASQARSLQHEVNGYLAQTGGTQVSANRVDFAGGSVIVAVPGQKYAHDHAAPSFVPTSYSNCLSGDFCAYSGGSGSGTMKSYYICQDVVPFSSGQGSVYNHQTGGAAAYLYRYRSNGTTYLALTLTPPNTAAWSWIGTADIRTC
jgi:hypothetical protein